MRLAATKCTSEVPCTWWRGGLVVDKEKKMETIPIDRSDLESVLQLALGRELPPDHNWQVTALQGGLEFGSTVYRLQGIEDSVKVFPPWSLILKVIHADDKYADPLGYRYWKREVEAYRSGLLERLPGALAAPRCYSVSFKADGSAWIWMEDVKDEGEVPWSMEQYGGVARRLGQFNGAFLAGHPLPTESWLTHNWLRKYLAHAAPTVGFIRENPAHPVVQKMLLGITLPLTLAVWDEHQRMLEALDRLPQTFCHQDAFGRNLFIRGEQVMAIDWGYAGIAPLGAELAPLVGVASGLAGVPSSQLKELDRVCFEGYLQGMEEAGFIPDHRQVRLGYTLTVMLRYVLGATIGEVLPAILESEELREHWAKGFGTSVDKVADTEAGVAAYYQGVMIEALKLLGLGCLMRVLGKTLVYSIRLGGKRKP